MRSPREEPKRSGSQAVIGAILAVVGGLAAAFPDNLLLRALSDAAPQLVQAVPAIITACGAIVAALSDPPTLSGGK